jgi:hypothetical protein
MLTPEYNNFEKKSGCEPSKDFFYPICTGKSFRDPIFCDRHFYLMLFGTVTLSFNY